MSIKVVNTSRKKRKSKTKQWTTKGLTILELVKSAKEGDKLKLVADYSFGLTHDTYKTHTLKDPEYVYKSGSTEYNPGTCRVTVKTTSGILYSIFANDDQRVGFELIKK